MSNYSRFVASRSILLIIALLGTDCNPIAFNPGPIPLIAIHPATGGFQAPILMAGGQPFDPYAGAASFNQMSYFMAPTQQATPFALNPFDVSAAAAAASNRRSLHPSLMQRNQAKDAEPEIDEQKLLGDIPLSFVSNESRRVSTSRVATAPVDLTSGARKHVSQIEPDPPSSLTERISESFSALGEGFKNHFRSMSENFSDTMDDVKDAWRTKPASSNNDDKPEEKKRFG